MADFDWRRAAELQAGLEYEDVMTAQAAIDRLTPLMAEVDSQDAASKAFLHYVWDQKDRAVAALVEFGKMPASALSGPDGRLSAAVLEIHATIGDYSRVVDYLLAVVGTAVDPSGDGAELEGALDDTGDYDGRQDGDEEPRREQGRRVVSRRIVSTPFGRPEPGRPPRSGKGSPGSGKRAGRKPAGKRRPPG